LSKIFTAKKNEYTKIAVTFSVSKGRALRVFATISTPRFTSGSILPKNLDSRHFSGCLKSISFFFFFSFFFFLFLVGENYLWGAVALIYSPFNRYPHVQFYFEVLQSEI
jgi:hypothetical protein